MSTHPDTHDAIELMSGALDPLVKISGSSGSMRGEGALLPSSSKREIKSQEKVNE